jgi:hypothetical protein
MKLKAAISDLYSAFMMSEDVQKFARAHPEQKMTVSLTVTIQSTTDEKCQLTMKDGGFEVQSDDMTRTA